MSALPLGLIRGSQLGGPFDPERIYVDERDPKLLRAVGLSLSRDTFSLLNHCDKAGTGDGDDRTQATEVAAQWSGKNRLLPKMQALLAEIPKHYEFENTEVEEPWVPSERECEKEIAIRAGSFDVSAEPRIYGANVKDGIAAPRPLWSAIELM